MMFFLQAQEGPLRKSTVCKIIRRGDFFVNIKDGVRFPPKAGPGTLFLQFKKLAER
jgi:hypothetical protein